MPCQVKMLSRITKPLNKPGSVRPIKVTNGISVFRKAWRTRT